jgi:hypothetical protein
MKRIALSVAALVACSSGLPGQESVSPEQAIVFVRIIGAGTVRSAPGGIDCSSNCGADFARHAQVVLTAEADPGWRFEAWTGNCGGNTGCTLYVSRDREATAVFVRTASADQPLIFAAAGCSATPSRSSSSLLRGPRPE